MPEDKYAKARKRLENWASTLKYAIPCDWKGKPSVLAVIGSGVVLQTATTISVNKYAPFENFRSKQLGQDKWETSFYRNSVVIEATAPRMRDFHEALSAEREKLDAPRRTVQVTEHDRLVQSCTYLAGTSLPLIPNSNYDLLVKPASIEFHMPGLMAANPAVAQVDVDDLRQVELSGPGRVTTDGGFMGGGFGAKGALEGMAVASVLNSATRRSSITSILHLSGACMEAFLLHQLMAPDELRRHLSPLFVRINIRAEESKRPNETKDDISVKLVRVAELYNSGALTPDEFASAKKAIINSN